jgi:hypothetical protein
VIVARSFAASAAASPFSCELGMVVPERLLAYRAHQRLRLPLLESIEEILIASGEQPADGARHEQQGEIRAGEQRADTEAAAGPQPAREKPPPRRRRG